MWRANDNSERRNHELLIASAAMSRVPGANLASRRTQARTTASDGGKCRPCELRQRDSVEPGKWRFVRGTRLSLRRYFKYLRLGANPLSGIFLSMLVLLP